MPLASLPDLGSSVRLETPRAASDETNRAGLWELPTGLGIPAPVIRIAGATAANTTLELGFPVALKPARG